jgi:PAS domain S-box-containing protein/diguanylate cyclase (GGDEF)-like protein
MPNHTSLFSQEREPHVQLLNPVAFQKLTGYISETLQQPNWWLEGIHPEDRPFVIRDFLNLRQQGDSLVRRYRFRHAEGYYLWIEDTLQVIARDRQSLQLIALWRDISDALLHEKVAENIHTSRLFAIALYRERFIYANEVFLQSVGASSISELMQYTPLQLVHPCDKEKVAAVVDQRLKGQGQRLDYTFRALDLRQRVHHVCVTSQTIDYHGEPAGLVVLSDVTEQIYHSVLAKLEAGLANAIAQAEDWKSLRHALLTIGVEETAVALLEKHEEAWQVFRAERVVEQLDAHIGRQLDEQHWHDGLYLCVNEATQQALIEALFPEKTDLCDLACLPVLEQGVLRGVLCLARIEPDFFHDSKTRDMLQGISKLLANRLDLYRQARRVALLQKTMLHSQQWWLVTDLNKTILDVNPAVEQISGYSRGEIIGQTPRLFKSGLMPDEYYEKLYAKLAAGEPFEGVFINRHKSGALYYLQGRIIPIELDDGAPGYVFLGQDITSETNLRAEVALLEYTDPLTEGLNKKGFVQQLDLHIKSESDDALEVVVLDLVHFSDFNHAYGVTAGDQLLKDFFAFLQDLDSHTLFVGRIAGDRFALVHQEDNPALSFYAMMPKVKRYLQSYHVEGKPAPLSVVAGISRYPVDGETADTLLFKAELALRHLRDEDDLNKVSFFDVGHDAYVRHYYRALRLIADAYEHNRFEYVYQPYFSITDQTLKGCEALLRIRTEKGELLTPSEFIDHFETAPFLEEVSLQLLNKIEEFLQQTPSNLKISFNITLDLVRCDAFIDVLLALSEAHPRRLVIELTERRFAQLNEHERKKLFYLRETGAFIAVDDFGTGYSSLIYLKTLPLDLLKIDRAFTAEVTRSKQDRTLVEAIITMGQGLELKTLAEGVEEADQLQVLAQLGCDYAQGYYFHRPMEQKDFLQLIKEQIHS